jgi:hypothetical protein|tara:strand:- start:113 stop:259 length:147 start_codon:yes stop_codon:yes gene_type:complete
MLVIWYYLELIRSEFVFFPQYEYESMARKDGICPTELTPIIFNDNVWD